MAEIHCSLERAWLCPRGWSVSRPLGFTSNMPFQAPERSHPLRGTHMKLTWNLSVGKVHWESSLWVLEKIVLKRMSCPASCHTLQEPAEESESAHRNRDEEPPPPPGSSLRHPRGRSFTVLAGQEEWLGSTNRAMQSFSGAERP